MIASVSIYTLLHTTQELSPSSSMTENIATNQGGARKTLFGRLGLCYKLFTFILPLLPVELYKLITRTLKCQTFHKPNTHQLYVIGLPTTEARL